MWIPKGPGNTQGDPAQSEQYIQRGKDEHGGYPASRYMWRQADIKLKADPLLS
jgi:hypothetical protein